MEFSTPESFGEYQLTYRSGDVIIPRVEPAEPLALELQDFARAMLTGSKPVSHAQLGVDVVTAMEAVEMSLMSGGAPVALTGAPEAAVA
jgi:predicted dehydrogenase